ncbi:Transcription factor grauzone [Pseudolycoriella hygida]|uniref:Transcription factor grauzone n=1 Tax=Pseudolycoriella hygida TaxID=35572 RepID=A0A9Q0MP75_9DIPT|nr:Transcription factor grauzone [Pseudolycoriella hygida]
MGSNSAQLCRLCIENASDVVNVFDTFEDSTIASILTQHFWFQVCKDDGYSEYLCQACWMNTKTFHNFYKRVECRQKENWDLASLETHIVKEEPRFGPTLEADLTLVKNEVTDPPVPVQICEEESDKFNCGPNENLQMEIDAEDSNDKGDSISSSFTPNSHESNDEGDLDDSNQKPTFYGITLKEKNKKIREFFDLSCQICNETFETFNKAKKHYRAIHNVPFLVYCCGRKFNRITFALSHIFHHQNPDSYRCETCDKRFSHKAAFQKHIKNHEQPDSIESFAHKCDICTNRSYKSAYSLTQHMRLKHSSDEDKKFHCDKCNKKFLSQTTLSYHIRVDHELAYQSVCDICARVFKDKNILRKHMKIHSTTVPQEKVQCHLCGTWLNKDGLPLHLRRHQNVAGAECTICNKTLKNRPSLLCHIRTAHGERRHQCTFCGKKFRTRIILKEHIAFHTGQDLYECEYCPKTFKSSANKCSHRKKVHFEEWMRNRKEILAVEHPITKQDSEKLHSTV